jgi:hypothetical protein
MTPVNPAAVLDQLQIIVNSVIAISNMMHAAQEPGEKPPETGGPVTPPSSEYGPHGFTAADDDGFARFRALDEFLATVPEKLRSKFPTRFCTAELWELGVFPSAIAREKCYQNLISRMRSPIAVPQFFNWDAWSFRTVGIAVTGERDWNIGPLQAAKTYSLEPADLLVGQAWSENWKPGGEARLLEALKAKLVRELEPKDPIDTGGKR